MSVSTGPGSAVAPSPAPPLPPSGGLLLRILPPVLYRRRRAALPVLRNFMVYRRAWMIVVSGFFEPLFYLLSIGVGIGKLVGHVHGAGASVTYTQFVAPGLMAASAMNGAIYESTMNVFFKLKQAKVYDAMLATPLGVMDVALGEIGYSVIRGAAYSAVFLVVMAAMGLILSWWALLALGGAILIGFGFAAVGMAVTSYMKTWADFDLVQMFILPLFLFSADFYPLSTYPVGLQWLVRFTPLYNGVVLLRALTVGTVSWATLGHAAYLLAMGLAGLAVAARRLHQRLLT